MIYICGAHLHPMFAGIAHDLGRGIETHRLGIEQRTGKSRRKVAFQPARNIDKMCEAGSMAFREAIFAKSPDLVEAALSEVAIVTARHHPFDHHLFQFVHFPPAAERGHRLPQPVGFRGRKSGRIQRDLHRLFLKDGHAQRPGKNAGKFVRRAVLRRGRRD